MSLAWLCDKQGCDTWQRLPDECIPRGWLVVATGDDGDEQHFCSIECLLVHHAQFEPLEEM
ncbi:MAG: hypothetical protein ACRDMV_05755 [Streptosporangiales bacterium]